MVSEFFINPNKGPLLKLKSPDGLITREISIDNDGILLSGTEAVGAYGYGYADGTQSSISFFDLFDVDETTFSGNAEKILSVNSSEDSFIFASDLFWDDSLNRLGILQNTPQSTLHVGDATPGGIFMPGIGIAYSEIFYSIGENSGNGLYVGSACIAQQTDANNSFSIGLFPCSGGLNASGIIANQYGLLSKVEQAGAGTTTNGVAVGGFLSNAGGTITNGICFNASRLDGIGAITNAYGFYATGISGPDVTNGWGVFIEDSGLNNYFEGDVICNSDYKVGTSTSNVENAYLSIGAGRNSASESNAYLRGYNGVPTNLSAFIVPFNATIIAISAGGNNPQTWTAEVRKNGSATVIASIDLVSATSAFDNTDSTFTPVDIDAGDKIEFFCNGTTISYPRMDIVIKRRV